MTATLASLMGYFAAGRTARRRARNLRSAARPAPAPRLRLNGLVLLACGVVVLGAVVLAQSARSLSAAAGGAAPEGVAALATLEPLLGGATIRVPQEPGIAIVQHGGAALVVASSMRMDAPLRIDLCSQLPLRIGYPFTEAAAFGASRTVLLAAQGSAMPRIDLRGDARDALRLAWNAGAGRAAWTGDAAGGAVARGARGEGRLGQSGWLVWKEGALRFTRRASAACPGAGELLIQRVGPGAAGTGLVQAFGSGASPAALQLAPGDYLVPATKARALEDALLFERLHQHGLIRLGHGGLVEIAPRDLAAWLAAPADGRAPLPGWDKLQLDAEGRKLLERLYYRADGAFVREQARVFNSERRLLAWRVRPGAERPWQASVGGVPVTQTDGLPVAAMRLFARLPEGWAPWRRVGAWDGGGAARTAALALDAAGPVDLLLAGRVRRVEGATAAMTGACDGRACRDPDAVQRVRLAPLPGARRIVLEVEPLDLAQLAGGADAAYRHLRLDGGALAWHALPAATAPARSALAEVNLADRHGQALWSDGRASAVAQAAGLGPLLGVHREHASSVAGMLARLPGSAHAAQLTLDLHLQAAAQAALDCIGLREGKWDGKTCTGFHAAPARRQAGLVLLDAGNGDVLAAAGAGMGVADPARWPEVRDFDRADPARSPLRLPAFQHDGGAQRAPGSTFKIVTALGAEAAARKDAQLERLLQGLPLADIDAMARDAGYGFRTAAPAYPDAGGARITNFREQQAGIRAVEGRLGLAQAMTHSINTWFAWTAELGDRSLGGRPQGGTPGVMELEPGALDGVRPVAGMARKLGFGAKLRLDGGLLPEDYAWSSWDALQASASRLDPIQTRHEVRQMAIGLRMQATPLQMALVAGAVGQGRIVAPRLLLALDGKGATAQPGPELGVRLDRIRAGMKGVVDSGTAAGAFRGKAFDSLRPGLFGKTGTAPTGDDGLATVWFTGWLEPGSLPGQTRRLAFAAFVSQSSLTGGAHAAPIVAALLRSVQQQSHEKKGE
ncbi:penicillin-binding transpeptidase domain-containing protein [Massilia yuzhufengensis]|uniref:Penicillin binding protein transpeptidase domain-containing protein n=1 Tax=Massilia yuzhufengensis TaxID=1164594 RepID=A0A1I1PM67_9BURK|nr:penicillin-binding transpeptidase domain-containing protein [Massilia yuzhufengensis]SFD10994.1 Penicillin binding protein transpeptidase domain-containing protein [Massilia yuzhufengensis]